MRVDSDVLTFASSSEAEGISVIHRSPGLTNVPRWTLSDAKIRQVVAFKLCLILGEPNVPTDLIGLRDVEARVMAHGRTNARDPRAQKHLEIVKRFGGPMAYWTSICFRRWRLGWDCATLGKYYEVRIGIMQGHLHRLRTVARAIFPDPSDHLPIARNAKPEKWKPKQLQQAHPSWIDPQRVLELRQQRLSFAAIGARLKCTGAGAHGALRRAGLLKPDKRGRKARPVTALE